ncbi:phosphoribosylanthranilate isomerase [Pedobacter sp. PWIIR3]
MRDPANIREVSQIAPDFMGFIFYKESKRYAGNLSPANVLALPKNIHRIGVFVNEDLNEVLRIVDQFKLSGVQLHGSESADYCMALNNKSSASLMIIKAFGIDEHFDFNSLNEYVDAVNYFLFDTQTPAHGGSGKVFNWKLLQQYKLAVPYFLSGGISEDQVNELHQINDDRFYAIDVNSRFELQPGIKDYNKLKHFKTQL